MLFRNLFKDEGARELGRLQPLVRAVNALSEEYAALSDDALRGKTAFFRGRLAQGEPLDALLPEAFAAVREASVRTLGQRHYDVQLLGGMILHHDGIAEMRTGEGKTLVATLPTYLHALAGKGVHVVTVNDYLARRDTVWMGQIYAFLGMSVGVVNGGTSSYLYDPGHVENDTERDAVGSFKVVYEFLRPCDRKEAYAADITYGTNNEFAFDYLRDNLAYTQTDVVGREHYYAIVDEVDSILIDEARTPLIISAPAAEAENLYATFSGIAAHLQQGRDFTVDEKHRAVSMTDEGIAATERLLGIENLYTEKGIKHVHHLENAVRAKALFHKDKEYVVREGEIVIVDEFTGRLQPGRRWSEGLHQAIEAKEGLSVKRESRTVASITFQNYFKLYKKLAGMTGTALTSREEFRGVYNLNVVPVPTNKQVARADRNDLIFQTERGKFQALARRIKEIHSTGRPVLVGTTSIEKNEVLAAYLTGEGVPHEVLNAKNHEREGEIIAQAGRLHAVTIATNMAGRGVDIILGGSPLDKTTQERVRSLGGLTVLGTERHEARRIDNQLRGRSGRQGDPGETQFFVSLEDSLMRVFAADSIKAMMGRFGIPEDEPIENRLITRALENAQTKIEGFHFDSRKQVLEYDTVLNHQRQTLYASRKKVLMGDAAQIRAFVSAALAEHPDARGVIEAKERELGESAFLAVASHLILRAMDIHWMEHLDTMDYLRSSVNLRAYGQRDPIIEYKKEALRLFKDMERSMYGHAAHLISQVEKKAGEGGGQVLHADDRPQNLVLQGGSDTADAPASSPARAEDAIGRNDLCPCGSGKKYKKCHGK